MRLCACTSLPTALALRWFGVPLCLLSLAFAQTAEPGSTPTPQPGAQQPAAQPPAAQPPAVQQPANTPPAANQPAGTAGNVPAAPGNQDKPVSDNKPAAQGSGMALGTLLVDSSKVRCWPTGHSPSYDDAFAKGAVVGVGRSESGFRQVVLPLGPVGYVFKKFAGEMQAGKVTTKGKAVAFRYRPKSGEPPVTSLAEGTALWVLGEQDDWWRVRNPGVECWLPEADVQVFEQAPETMQKAWAELQKTQTGEVQAYLASIEKAREEARLETERAKDLLALQDQFGVELKKPSDVQSLEKFGATVAEFVAKLPDSSMAKPGAVELQKRVAQQKWVVEATAARDAPVVPPKDLPQTVPEVRDPMERFQAVGYLRWERGLTGPGQYVVEKGGQRLYLVTCNSGRYELSQFVGREIGMIGSRRRPATDSLRVLDVEKLEVLAGTVR